MKTLSPAVAALIGLMGTSTPAFANPANVSHVTEGLIAAGIAVELSEQCDSVSIRYLRGINFLQGLRSDLESLGYSRAEIDAYIDDDAEQDRLEALARARLASLGAVAGDAQSHCMVARAQIAQGTQIGRLLR